MQETSKVARFESAVLPHLGAAYNLARWLTRDDHDAEDMVQEAYLRAFKFFDRYRGGDARTWLLTVVRNTCLTWLKQNRARDLLPFDEEAHSASDAASPDSLLVGKATVELVREAVEELPAVFREVVVLRDLEGLSYKDIAAIADVPLGTVMSRLTRARARLRQGLAQRLNKEP